MTTREDFLSALQARETTRMPFCYLVDNAYYPEGMPERFLEPLDIVAMQRWIGFGAVTERVGPAVTVRSYRNVRYSLSDVEDGLQTEDWQSGNGTIRRRFRQTAGGTFFEQRGIVEVSGYSVLRDAVEDASIDIDTDAVEATRRRLQEIGEDGILYSVGPSSPIMELVRSWVDLDRFVYDMADHPGLIDSLLHAMAEANYREYEALASTTPAKVIVFWDCVNSLQITPAQFREYVVPVYRRYAEICHRYGKILVCHTCGRIRAFMGMFLETNVDAIDWLTPPETGDVVFRDAQRLWDAKMGIMGTLLPAIVRFEPPDALERHIHEVLKGVDTRRGFIFQAPIPGGTPMANVERIRQVAKKYGA